MKKIIHFSLALLIGLPVCSQPLTKTFGLWTKTSKNTPATTLLPKESERYDYRMDSSLPYLVSYDRFGHETAVTDPAGLTKEVCEYDATGNILLNKYTETRKSVSDAWIKPDKYALRTTLNAEGIRTAVEDEEYTSIKLNDLGLVTYYKTKTTDGMTTDGTLSWDGYQLKGLTIHDKINTSEQNIELDKLELYYSPSDFNPYGINYYNMIAYGLYEADPVFIGVNASGTISGISSGQTMSAVMTFSSRTEEKQEGMYEAPRAMKGYTKGELFLSMDICDYKFTKTDANGSYIFEDHYYESENGYPSTYTYTVSCDENGNVTKQQQITIENEKVKSGVAYRYAWSYDSDNKPLKVDTYYSLAPDYKETLVKSETFTGWYDPAGINTLQLTDGNVLSATLYTLSGTPVRELSAGEVSSGIRIPADGVYLLRIKTDKGSIVKKVMR